MFFFQLISICISIFRSINFCLRNHVPLATSMYLTNIDARNVEGAQPRKPGSSPTPGAATKTLVQAGHVTPQNLGYF